MENFKQCMIHDLLKYLGDKDIKNINETKVLTDSYTVTCKNNFHLIGNFRHTENYENSSVG